MNMTDFTFGDDVDVDREDILVGEVAEPVKAGVSADEPTLLAALKDTLAKEVKRDDVLIEVPERPGLVIRFSPNITQHQIKAWRRASGDDKREGMDAVRFASHVLANTCTGMTLNGKDITEGGDPVTFSHETVMKMVGAHRVFDCVREVYGLDPHIESAALAVLDASGFNDDVERVDPTKTS
jgi:hypothetical protein